MLQRRSYAVFLIREGDVVGIGSYFRGSIRHGYSHACKLEHAQVVVAVAEGYHIGRGEIDLREESSQRLRLVDSLRHQFEEEWGRAEDIHLIAHHIQQFLFSLEHIRWVARHEELGRMRLQCFEQILYLADVHLVDARFFLHILIVWHFGDDFIAGVSQQGMALLSCVLI